MSSQRTRKIESLLVREVADILMKEIRDPRVVGVTVTGAKVSADLQHATVYYQQGTVGGASLEDMAAGLESSRRAVRAIFGKRVRIKYLPDIKFRHDGSLEYAEHIESLLRQVSDFGGEDEESGS